MLQYYIEFGNSGEYLLLPGQPHGVNRKKNVDYSCLGLKGEVANRHIHQDVDKYGRAQQTLKQSYQPHKCKRSCLGLKQRTGIIFHNT